MGTRPEARSSHEAVAKHITWYLRKFGASRESQLQGSFDPVAVMRVLESLQSANVVAVSYDHAAYGGNRRIYDLTDRNPK